MKKIIYSIKKWWKKTTEEYHRQQVLKREKEVRREAMHRLQVREFESGLYLCLDDIPILRLHKRCLTPCMKRENIIRTIS